MKLEDLQQKVWKLHRLLGNPENSRIWKQSVSELLEEITQAWELGKTVTREIP